MDKKFENKTKENILKKLEDIKKKIETNEPCPESPQDINLWIHIDDRLDEALQPWYY